MIVIPCLPASQSTLYLKANADKHCFIFKEGELTEEEFSQDKHIPDILVFSPGTDLHEHPLYKSGHILLQDKVTLISSQVLYIGIYTYAFSLYVSLHSVTY